MNGLTPEDFQTSRMVYHSAYGFGYIIKVEDGKCFLLFQSGFSDWFTIEYLIRSSGFYIRR